MNDFSFFYAWVFLTGVSGLLFLIFGIADNYNVLPQAFGAVICISIAAVPFAGFLYCIGVIK